MIKKLALAFSFLKRDLISLQDKVDSIDFKDGSNGIDGESPSPESVAKALIDLMPKPEKVDENKIISSVLAKIPAPRDGRDGVANTSDVAALVLAKMPKPKNGKDGKNGLNAPKLAQIVKAVDGKEGKRGPRGMQGKPGKNGASVTDLKVQNNEVFVYIDGRRKKAGEINVTRGGGGGYRPQKKWFSKQIPVTTAYELSGELRSDVVYFLDGVIDFTGTGYNIALPEGGLSFSGHSLDVSGLSCSDDNYTLFVSPEGGSGNFLGNDFFIDVSGQNSKVFDIVDSDGLHAIEFYRINYNNCASLGAIDSYRQGLEVGCGRFGGTPELTLKGAWSGGYFIDTSIVRGLDDGAYSLFKSGDSFIMQSRFKCSINLDLPSSSSFMDFSTANFPTPSTLQLVNCIVTREGLFDSLDDNITPNIQPLALSSAWSSNVGLGNTFVGGETEVITEQSTQIDSIDTFYDIEGVFQSSSLQHFDSTVSGQLRHIGLSPVEFSLSGEIDLESDSGNEISIKVVVFRSSTSTFIDGKILTRIVWTSPGSRDLANIPIRDNIILNQNDYVKLQVSSANSTSDITAEAGSFFLVNAR